MARMVRIRVKRVRIRVIPGSEGTWIPPYQALRTPGPLVQGDLDLSNTYPGSPWEGPWLPGQNCRRYRNTGAASLLRTTLTRRETGPLSPGHGSRQRCSAARCCSAWSRRAVVAGVYLGLNGMALAGHLGHYYPGVHPSPPCTIIFFPGYPW